MRNFRKNCARKSVLLKASSGELLLQQIYYSAEVDPRIPQHLRRRSLQQLQMAKTSYLLS